MSSTDAAQGSGGGLAQALVRHLLPRLELTRAALEGLGAAAIDADGAHDLELAASARATHEAGWMLALIAEAEGARLLGVRHETRGLVVALRELRGTLRARGIELELGDVPGLAPAGGWRLCWAILEWVWSAAGDLEWGSRLTLGRCEAGGVDGLTLRGVLRAPRAPVARGVRVDFEPGRARLFVPRGWIVPDQGPAGTTRQAPDTPRRYTPR